MTKPHDALFRHVFGAVEHAAPLLRSCLPAELAAAIDWSSLRRCAEPQVDERLRDHLIDLLFSARIGPRRALLYTVLDHQSGNQRFLPLRLLGYVVGTLKDHRRDPAHRRDRHLPIVIPVVVHCGNDRWRSPREVFDLFDLEGLPEAAARTAAETLPRFRYRLDDVQRCDEQQLRGRALSLVGLVAMASLQFLAPVRGDLHGVRQWLTRWADALRAVGAAALSPTGQDAMEAVRSYILRVTRLDQRRLQIEFQQHVDEPTMKKFVSTWDRAVREGVAKGKREGEARGEARGKARGKVEGQSSLLLRLLRRRFGAVPDAIETRLHAATPEQLELWADRVLDAATLDAVFAD